MFFLLKPHPFHGRTIYLGAVEVDSDDDDEDLEEGNGMDISELMEYLHNVAALRILIRRKWRSNMQIQERIQGNC
ncbi:hypothetical protein EV426DRAFT_700658 [Tirmania nivea]|nr:hypothetical protein EV426DRAFT_700658 [Tirmania nivea]